MKRVFRNKKTGKRMTLDEVHDKHLIASLEKDKDYQELVVLG